MYLYPGSEGIVPMFPLHDVTPYYIYGTSFILQTVQLS